MSYYKELHKKKLKEQKRKRTIERRKKSKILRLFRKAKFYITYNFRKKKYGRYLQCVINAGIDLSKAEDEEFRRLVKEFDSEYKNRIKGKELEQFDKEDRFIYFNKRYAKHLYHGDCYRAFRYTISEEAMQEYNVANKKRKDEEWEKNAPSVPDYTKMRRAYLEKCRKAREDEEMKIILENKVNVGKPLNEKQRAEYRRLTGKDVPISLANANDRVRIVRANVRR